MGKSDNENLSDSENQNVPGSQPVDIDESHFEDDSGKTLFVML